MLPWRLTHLIRRACHAECDATDVIIVARAFSSLRVPVSWWNLFATHQVEHRGMPLVALAACFHSLTVQKTEGSSLTGTSTDVCARSLLTRIVPNINQISSLREASFVSFGFAHHAHLVHPHERSALADRVTVLCGRGGAMVDKERFVALIHNTLRMNLSRKGLYEGLSTEASRFTFTPQEAAPIAMCTGMSTVSDQAAPLLSAVLKSIRSDECRRMKGNQVGALLHGMAKCDLLDHGHDRLVTALADRLKGNAGRMEVRHIVFAASALARSRSHRRLDVIIPLVVELTQRNAWGTVADGMLAALVTPLAAVATSDPRCIQPFAAEVKRRLSKLSPRTVWGIRKALAEHPLPQVNEELVSLLAARTQNMENQADVVPTVTSDDALRLWIEQLAEAVHGRADRARVDHQVKRILGVKDAWVSLSLRSVASLARALSKVPLLPPREFHFVIELAVNHKQLSSADAETVSVLLRAMGRTAFRRWQWSQQLCDALDKADVSHLTKVDICATLAALVAQRYMPVKLAARLMDHVGDLPTGAVTLIECGEGVSHLAGATPNGVQDALRVRSSLARCPLDDLDSVRYTIRGVLVLTKLGASQEDLHAWQERVERMRSLSQQLTLADVRHMAITVDLLPLHQGYRTAIFDAFRDATARLTAGVSRGTSQSNNVHLLATALSLRCEEAVWLPVVNALDGGVGKLFASAVPSGAIVAGLLRLEVKSRSRNAPESLATLSRECLVAVRNTITFVADSEDDLAVVMAAVAGLAREGSVAACEIVSRATKLLVQEPRPPQMAHRVPLSALGLRALCRALACAPDVMSFVADVSLLADFIAVRALAMKATLSSKDLEEIVIAFWAVERSDIGKGRDLFVALHSQVHQLAKGNRSRARAPDVSPTTVANLAAEGLWRPSMQHLVPAIAERILRRQPTDGSKSKISLFD
jgi:hypothetical protein